jgi:hypothetical protein
VKSVQSVVYLLSRFLGSTVVLNSDPFVYGQELITVRRAPGPTPRLGPAFCSLCREARLPVSTAFKRWPALRWSRSAEHRNAPHHCAKSKRLALPPKSPGWLSPKGEEPNLASQVLGAACKALADQWLRLLSAARGEFHRSGGAQHW